MQEEKLKRSLAQSPECAKKYLDIADNYWKNFRFEEAARACLAYLHNYMEAPQYEGTGASYTGQLEIVITCGGRGARWKNFMGREKQLIDTGDGIPLLQRTINQFSNRFPETRCHILIGEEQAQVFTGIRGCSFIYRSQSADYPLGVETLHHQTSGNLRGKEILWILGDAFFTNKAVSTIYSSCRGSGKTKYFGRRNGNPRFKGNGGEMFGWFIPSDKADEILSWYLLTEEIYKGTPLFRFSSWEAISLMTWAQRHGLTSPNEVKTCGLTPSDLCMEISEIFRERNFDSEIWVEIDDATEDFDFPIEYLNRLRLLVQNADMRQSL